MEKDNKRKIIMLISLIFVAIVLVIGLYALIQTAISSEIDEIRKRGRIVTSSFKIISLIASIWYISAGFKNSSAKYFKFFLYTFILVELLIFFVQVVIIKASIFIIISTLIPLFLLNVLFGTKDLGKKTSLILSTIILIRLLYIIIFYALTSSSPFINIVLWNLDDISLSIVLVVMMHLKYYDKALRNTK